MARSLRARGYTGPGRSLATPSDLTDSHLLRLSTGAPAGPHPPSDLGPAEPPPSRAPPVARRDLARAQHHRLTPQACRLCRYSTARPTARPCRTTASADGHPERRLDRGLQRPI